MLIYHMSCTCNLTADQVIIHTHSRFKTCPKHYGSKCLRRSKSCVICGERFDFSFRSCIPASCLKCRQKMNWAKEKSRRKNRERLVNTDEVLHFECGCSTPREKAKKLRIDGSHRFACEKHKEPVSYRIGTCAVCNQEFETKARGRMPGTCRPCQRSLGIELVESRQEFDPMYRPNQKTEASVERSDCRHRIECCDKWDGKASVLPCLGCTEYIPKAIKPGVFAYRNSDPYLWAQGG